MAPVIHVSNIRKAYGRTVALDDVSFDVHAGEIFGLIGPNGAGKTTTMECAEGLRTPDAGTVSVLGLDPRRDVYALQERIGVQLQEAQLQKRIRCARRWSCGPRSTRASSIPTACSSSSGSPRSGTRGS
jgi:ABC-2 type transport system ATP-binding protein